MNNKELTEVLDYLKVIQCVYNNHGWSDSKRSRPISVRTISQVRNFLTALTAQVPLIDIPKPDEVYPVEDGSVGIDWFRITEKGEMDLFYVHVKRDGSITYKSSFDSLKTSIEKTTMISDILDELLLIHIKHFN
jgi:hypothetical protein